MTTKTTDPMALRAAQLALELAIEAHDDLIERIDECEGEPHRLPEARETVFVHSINCPGGCEYACGGVFITTDEDGCVVEVER